MGSMLILFKIANVYLGLIYEETLYLCVLKKESYESTIS